MVLFAKSQSLCPSLKVLSNVILTEQNRKIKFDDDALKFLVSRWKEEETNKRGIKKYLGSSEIQFFLLNEPQLNSSKRQFGEKSRWSWKKLLASLISLLVSLYDAYSIRFRCNITAAVVVQTAFCLSRLSSHPRLDCGFFSLELQLIHTRFLTNN